MFRKFFIALTVAAILFQGPIPPQVSGQVTPSTVPITARSAILIDPRTDSVVFAKNPNRKAPPASTTKVVTALVVLDHLSLKRVVRIPRGAESIPASEIHLRGGEKFTVRDLLEALLIASANDAAYTLAVETAGSQRQFAQMMNARVRRMGCHNTQFVNASGLPGEGQYSTAYDLARIMKEARRYPFIVKTLKKKSSTIRALTGRKVHLRNHNKMLWWAPKTIEGKTGFTRKAKHCFVGRIHKGKKEFLVAILGSLSPWRDLKVLLYLSGVGDRWKMFVNQRNLGKSEVKAIQKGLLQAGFSPGPIDGIFGPRTLQAVRSFQKSHGLKPDGVVGPETWQKLKPYL